MSLKTSLVLSSNFFQKVSGPSGHFYFVSSQKPCTGQNFSSKVEIFAESRDFRRKSRFFRIFSKFFRKICFEKFFENFFSKNFRNCFFSFFWVFPYFRQILEEPGIFWGQNRVPRGILLQMGGFSGPYEAWRPWRGVLTREQLREPAPATRVS